MEKGKMHFTKKTAIAIALLTVTVLAIGTLFVACDNNTNDGATAIVDTDKTYQTMEGFGASSAWTYQALGTIEDEEVKEQAMEMLYGDSGGYPSYASAAAVILFAIVLTITCINLLISRKYTHY